MKTVCPTCQGHGFVHTHEPVSAPPKPIETDEKPKPKRSIKNNGNLAHLRKL